MSPGGRVYAGGVAAAVGPGWVSRNCRSSRTGLGAGGGRWAAWRRGRVAGASALAILTSLNSIATCTRPNLVGFLAACATLTPFTSYLEPCLYLYISNYHAIYLLSTYTILLRFFLCYLITDFIIINVFSLQFF